jgi:hypothetical protein
MKTWMMTAAMLTLSLTGLVQGAAASEQSAVVNFGFRIGSESMPPGRYEIVFDQQSRFTLRHVETGRRVFFHAPVAQDSGGKGGKVTFQCYGEACLLRSVTMAESGVERKAILKPAKNAPAAAIVRVALTR